MNQVQLEDCQNIGKLSFIDWEQFGGCTVLITGATGLIGQNLVNAIAYNSQKKGLDIKLILPVRNVEVAKRQFGWTGAEIIYYELGTELKVDNPVDFVIHLASPTNSKFFIEQPVDTMLAIIEGTRALLDWARIHTVKKFISLSTMEVYGFPEKGHKVKENELGAFDTMNARNSYPVAKIACETLCNSYWTQFGVPTVILRATQTFGPGVKYDDGRVFAQFMRCVIEKRNIVLKTVGLTERSYLYTADAVSAILVCFLKAEPGQAYTVANPDTYCSIRNMAQMVADEVARGSINVVFDIAEDIGKLGYVDTLYMDLDVGKTAELGWKPVIGLKDAYIRMIESVGGQ
ncbi:MAG: NAD(P)-dependent oxidoreductase [Lachnospiraceae bacterium]|nr:NAD(P)-dependent oxidoreductase [Lachnospiraceae bacterium]